MRPPVVWLAWGLLLALAATGVAWCVAGLVDTQISPLVWLAVGLVAVPPALLSIRPGAVARAADPVLVRTLSLVVLLALALAAVVLVVVVWGSVPADDQGPALALAGAAAVAAAVAYRVVGPRVERAAERALYRDRTAPQDLARMFSGRQSRAIPLDELVLQAAESLRVSFRLRRAEVWILRDGALHLWVSDPEVQAPPLSLTGMDPATVVQAGASGHGWIQVWLPQLLEGREDLYTRLAPMAHAGELLGILVIGRSVEDRPFDADEERSLVELARQLGLTLHNAKLDSALQASLDQVRRQADELQASRGRIVAASDAARRQIERDLHDGAQQRIVALAVKARLARQLMERDPARAGQALEELGTDIDGALQELRELAHGIYPPLLADKGLAEALSSVARRAALPTTVRAVDLPRFGPEPEATAYFCCLEALQNAGKYAGEAARVTIELRHDADALVFVVSDDGSGFEVQGRAMGAGFTNMNDRLGSLGGTLRVESAPGLGTKVTGAIPADQVAIAVN